MLAPHPGFGAGAGVVQEVAPELACMGFLVSSW
jgi:hypothetical protein